MGLSYENQFSDINVQDIHQELGIYASAKNQPSHNSPYFEQIDEMKKHVEKFSQSIHNKTYKEADEFKKLTDKTNNQSLESSLEALMKAAKEFYYKQFPTTDSSLPFLDKSSQGGFLNSLRLKASFFCLAVKVLLRDFPGFKELETNHKKRLLETIRENYERLFDNLAGMHIDVLKKLYNKLGEKFSDFEPKLYEFQAKLFGLDSKENPSKLKIRKTVLKQLITSIKNRSKAFYEQQGCRFKIDLGRASSGCPAFMITDSNGKSLPHIVKDWFKDLLDQYIYPNIDNLIQKKDPK